MKKLSISILFLLLSSLLYISCNTKPEITDSPTSGHLKVSVDESFAPILDSHVYTFQKLYKYAKVDAAYKSETDAVKDLLTDSARVIIVSRKLTPEETKVFEKLKIIPRVNRIAVDGVALIVHPNNPDTLLTLQQIQNIFTGKVVNWQQVSGKSATSDITIVFDNTGSSTARYILDSINLKQPLPAKVFAAKSNPALIDYVSNNPNAIGVLGVNWISDTDDSTAVSFLNKIKVVGVSRETSPTSVESYFQPYQGYLANNSYPLRRDLYVISREARAGLGTGFASFVAGDKGQRIFLKSGLMPAQGQVRLITITD